MNRDQTKNGEGLGLLCIVLGMAVWMLGRFEFGSMAFDTRTVCIRAGAVVAALGWFCFIWAHRKGATLNAGMCLLALGLAAMAGCLLAGWFPAMIAFGFLAVVGAILTVNTRR